MGCWEGERPPAKGSQGLKRLITARQAWDKGHQDRRKGSHENQVCSGNEAGTGLILGPLQLISARSSCRPGLSQARSCISEEGDQLQVTENLSTVAPTPGDSVWCYKQSRGRAALQVAQGSSAGGAAQVCYQGPGLCLLLLPKTGASRGRRFSQWFQVQAACQSSAHLPGRKKKGGEEKEREGKGNAGRKEREE